jgi:hypothetical protein
MTEFHEHIANSRERFTAEREQVFNQQEELQRKLDEINRELAAIDAYEAAKTGKTVKPTSSSAPKQTRVRRGSRRADLIELLRQSNEGLSRGEILERMGLKGDKSGEMSVSNALTALTKSNSVLRQNGKYVIGTPAGNIDIPESIVSDLEEDNSIETYAGISQPHDLRKVAAE